MADMVVAMVIRASDGARCSRFVPAPKVPAKNARSALLAEIAEATAGSALSAPELVEREPASCPSGTAMDFLGSVPQQGAFAFLDPYSVCRIREASHQHQAVATATLLHTYAARLGSPSFELREKAFRALARLAPSADGALLAPGVRAVAAAAVLRRNGGRCIPLMSTDKYGRDDLTPIRVSVEVNVVRQLGRDAGPITPPLEVFHAVALLYQGRTSDWPTYRSWLRQPRFLSSLDNLPWVTLSAAILLRVQQLLDTARPPHEDLHGRAAAVVIRSLEKWARAILKRNESFCATEPPDALSAPYAPEKGSPRIHLTSTPHLTF